MKRSTIFMGWGLPFCIATLVASNLNQDWFYVFAACGLSLFLTGLVFWIYDRE